MAVNIVILSALFFSCVAMTIALAVAWWSFRMPRHALSWSLAYGLSAVQAAVNLVAILLGRPPALMVLAFLLVIAPSPFVAIGARQRAGLKPRTGRFVAAAAATVLLLFVTAPIPALHPLSYSSATIFSSLCLVFCARALIPDGREPEPAEWAMFGAVVLLALVEFAAGLWTGFYLVDPTNARVTAIYHAILAVALPPAVVASGVAAVLLLASDLAVELRRLADRDPLTGILNRRGFHEAATRALSAGRGQRRPAVVALCDIDHFKAINDRFGHSVGDETIQHVARALACCSKPGDIVARVGGEEFALLLVDAPGSAATAERIRGTLATGFALGGRHVPLSASFGLAPVSAEGSVEEALARAIDEADQALYRSKTEGRDRITIAGAPPAGAPPPFRHVGAGG